MNGIKKSEETQMSAHQVGYFFPSGALTEFFPAQAKS